MMELNQSRHTLEELNVEKANVEKNNKIMGSEISECTHRLDDLYQSLNEGDILKKRLATEKTDLEKQIQDGENQPRNLNKMKVSLQNQLEDMKRLAESETRDKATLVGKFKSLETDLENLRERLEEENQIK